MMNRPFLYWSWLLMLVGCLVPAASADSASTQPRPLSLAVLVDPVGGADKLLVVPLIEASLGERTDVRLVDRSQITHLLREQTLMAAFEPGAVDRRVTLGQMIKADVLLLLRKTEDPKGAIELAVVESRSGLRILSQVVPLGKDAVADAAVLSGRVQAGLRKMRQEVKHVFAVPPFISDDLTYDLDALKAAYAALISRALLDRPGVLAVELAEADALAQEAAIGGDGVRRMLPTYVLGRYRHQGRGDDRRVTIEITTRTGGKEAHRSQQQDLTSEQATAYLRNGAVDALLKSVGLVEAQAARRPDAKLEVEQLVARIADFERLAMWDEALTLVDVALLLEPKRHDLHFKAIKLLNELAEAQHYNPATDRRNTSYADQQREHAKRRVRQLQLIRRQIPYAEAAVRFRPVPSTPWKKQKSASIKPGDFASGFRRPSRDNYIERFAPETGPLTIEIQREVQEALLRSVFYRFEVDPEDELIETLLDSIFWQLDGESLADAYQRQLSVVRRIQNGPRAVLRLQRMNGNWRPMVTYQVDGKAVLHATGPEVLAYVNALEKLETAEIRQEAQRMREMLLHPERIPPFQAKKAPVAAAPAAAPLEARFVPVEFKAVSVAGTPINSPNPRGWMSIGSGLDLVWDHEHVFLMRQKGVLQQLSLAGIRPRAVTWDGTHVWVAAQRQRDPIELLVIDPQRLTVYPLGAAQGLPPISDVSMAAIEPGRICVAAAFGGVLGNQAGRSWIGMATLSKDGKTGMKVFHEAKEVPDEESKTEWKRVHLRFIPGQMVLLKGRSAQGAQPVRQILFRRQVTNFSAGVHPLLIDTATLKVEPMAAEMWTTRNWDGSVNPAEGATYWVQEERSGYGEKPRGHLWRFGVPENARTRVASNVVQGAVQFLGSKVHIVGKTWQVADTVDGPFQDVKFVLPPVLPNRPDQDSREVGPLHWSAHYGLIHCGNSYLTGNAVYQVELIPRNAK